MSLIDQHRNALPDGHRLECFRMEGVLGHGGFGITYVALDEDLLQPVAIKEYLPRDLAFRDPELSIVPLTEADRETFEWGLEKFLDEARTLARFHHPNIVGVRRFIRANGTAYLVMDYCEGESLEGVLAREGKLSPERVEALLEPLLDALEALHRIGVTHRDIKPGNIYLRDDGSPVLLDFGGARQALAKHSRSIAAIATPGYAAFEQYSTRRTQGPWTDIYGLGATLYRCVTGQRPPDASDRMLEDDLVPATRLAATEYPLPMLRQIDAALRVRPDERPQSVADWRRQGLREAPPDSGNDSPADRRPAIPPDDAHAAPGSAISPENLPASPRPSSPPEDEIVLPSALPPPKDLPASPRPVSPPEDVPASPRPSIPPKEERVQHPADLIEGRYRIRGPDGEIVEDTVTGLEWQRCSLGQTWDGQSCAGSARRHTWDEAREAAGETAGWRLPTIDELQSLVYCSSGQPALFSDGRKCLGEFRHPTIVREAFPNTPGAPFWSDSVSADDSDIAWVVLFNLGSAGFRNRSSTFSVRLNVRLVRDPESRPARAAVREDAVPPPQADPPRRKDPLPETAGAASDKRAEPLELLPIEPLQAPEPENPAQEPADAAAGESAAPRKATPDIRVREPQREDRNLTPAAATPRKATDHQDAAPPSPAAAAKAEPQPAPPPAPAPGPTPKAAHSPTPEARPVPEPRPAPAPAQLQVRVPRRQQRSRVPRRGGYRRAAWIGVTSGLAAVAVAFWLTSERAGLEPGTAATAPGADLPRVPSPGPGTTSPQRDGLIEGRYRIPDSDNGVVEDTVTGLKWARCSLGQAWNGGTCSGEAQRMNWNEARANADRITGWRLPNLDELRTLVYCSSAEPARFSEGESCSGEYRTPTIVPEAFPNTPSSSFWSGSPDADSPNLAWSVSFGDGYTYSGGRSLPNRVRLVYGGE